MPHKCIRCGKVFADNSPQLLKGCECGSRVFIFLRDDQVSLKELVESGLELDEELKAVAAKKDVKEVDVSGLGWLEEELEFLTREKPVSIDLEAVENLRILEQGSYEINIASLMKGEPLVVKSEKGVYYIKLPQPKKKEKQGK